MAKVEVIAEVDKNDKPIGSVLLEEAHKKGILHREAAIFILNSSKQVLLQKKKDNKKWDFSSAGHLSFSESYQKAAIRELKEELGIDVKKEELIEIAYKQLDTIKPGFINKKFIKAFLIRKDISVKAYTIQKDEVIEVKYFTKEEILELLNDPKEPITNSCRRFLKEHLLKDM